MPDLTITTQDDLPVPDRDEPYVLFVNQTEYGNAPFLRTNMLSARPDLKKDTALRFRLDVKHHADAIGPGEGVVLVFMEALGLEPPLTLVCSDLHLQVEGYPVKQGEEIEIPMQLPGSRPPAKGFGSAMLDKTSIAHTESPRPHSYGEATGNQGKGY